MGGYSVVSALDSETSCVNQGTRISSKSHSLARVGEVEEARKRTQLHSSFPIYSHIFPVQLKHKRCSYGSCEHQKLWHCFKTFVILIFLDTNLFRSFMVLFSTVLVNKYF